jgi:hypothetical protein
MLIIKAHQRAINYTVDAAAAKALRDQGLTLAAIRDRLAPMVSLPTIARAIARAEEADAPKS